MAAISGAEGIPTVDVGSGGAPFQKITADPEAFGSRLGATRAAGQAGEAQGLQQLGEGAMRAANFFGDAAADSATNEFTDQVQKILHGDPTKKVIGPDGQEMPDLGYMALKGRAALDARPVVEKRIDEALKRTRDALPSPAEALRFDQYSRRFRSFSSSEVGRHADRQANTWYMQVNTASAKTAMDHISYNFDNPEQVATGANRLINAYVKNAELNGATPGDEVWKEAVSHGKRDALQAQLNAMAVTDPARAMRILEDPKNREIAGAYYDNMANRFRARADHQIGIATADRIVGAGMPLKDGADAQEVLRHFEGFRNTAYWDVNAWRTGYGSDTVTKADGTVVPVTQSTVVTKEDAERDLARRTRETQGKIRSDVGAEAWEKLDSKVKASLTSVAYNYGTLPKNVVEAVKNGDTELIAASISALGNHNGGVNARRRATEAANVKGTTPDGGRPSMRDQSEVMLEIQNDPSLSPAAKATAQSQANRLYGIYNAEATKTKAEFNEGIKDTTTEAMVTGSVQNPLTPDKFNAQFGDIDGPLKYRQYVSDIQFGADYKSLETMSDREQGQLLTAREPKAGPGFDHDQKNKERLQKAIVQIQDQRRDDPGGAVLRNPVVMEAMKGFDPNKPETFQKVAAARIAAQELLGIDADHQVPITKKEALALMAPLKRTLPGQEYTALKNIAEQFQTMFGDNSEKAFVYALRTQGKDQEVARQAAAAMKAVGLGLPVPRETAAALGAAEEGAAAQRAVTGIPGAPAAIPGFGAVPGSAPAAAPGRPTAVPGFGALPAQRGTEPSSWSEPVIPPAAINSLLADPTRIKEFNQKYGGAGVGEAILKKYGGGSGKPVPLPDRIQASP